MSKVYDIVRDALQMLRVVDAQGAPQPDDARDAIRNLNTMMRSWEAQGVATAWDTQTSPDDPMPTPDWMDDAITRNLAVRLRSRYGVTLDPDTVELARMGMNDILAKQAVDSHSRLCYDLPSGVYRYPADWKRA